MPQHFIMRKPLISQVNKQQNYTNAEYSQTTSNKSEIYGKLGKRMCRVPLRQQKLGPVFVPK